MTKPVYTEVRKVDGGWFTTELADGFAVSIRLASPTDATAAEHNDYDAKCSLCYLGYAHSGDYHRESIRRAEEVR